jgi:hypothetical protein
LNSIFKAAAFVTALFTYACVNINVAPQANTPTPEIYHAIQHDPVEVQPQLIEAMLSNVIVAIPNPPPIARDGVKMAALFSGGSVISNSPQVYPGCAPAPSTWTGTTYYINAGGNDSNPGTIGSPWKSFTKALGAGTVMVAGDTLDVQDSGGAYPGYPTDFGGASPGLQTQFSGFVRVQPAAGSSPILAGWNRLKDVKNILWENLTFQALQNGNAPFIGVESDGSPNSTQIILYNNTFQSTDKTTALTWNAAQWNANSRSDAIAISGQNASSNVFCISITHNTIQAVGANPAGGGDKTMMSLVGNNILAADNILNILPDDGIDWAGANIEIARNTITNQFPVADGNHNDNIQHQAGNCSPATFCKDTGDVIDGNYGNELTVPAAQLPLYQQCNMNGAQGIDSFDDQIDGAVITNNIVANCSTNGPIAFYSLTNSTIENNTTFKYVQNANDGGGCSILGVAHQSGVPNSSGDTLRNNICANITIDGTVDVVTNSMTIDHNLILLNGTIDATVSGTAHVYSAAGNYALGGGATNTITSTANSGVFTAADLSTPLWNFNPIAGSPAIANGTLPTASFSQPAYPNGAARTNPVNIGALGP